MRAALRGCHRRLQQWMGGRLAVGIQCPAPYQHGMLATARGMARVIGLPRQQAARGLPSGLGRATGPRGAVAHSSRSWTSVAMSVHVVVQQGTLKPAGKLGCKQTCTAEAAQPGRALRSAHPRLTAGHGVVRQRQPKLQAHAKGCAGLRQLWVACNGPHPAIPCRSQPPRPPSGHSDPDSLLPLRPLCPPTHHRLTSGSFTRRRPSRVGNSCGSAPRAWRMYSCRVRVPVGQTMWPVNSLVGSWAA